MDARFLIVAKFAEFGIDGKLNMIGGDQDKIIAENFPAVQRILTAACKVNLEKSDLYIDHEFKSCITNENGDTIAEGASGRIEKVELPPGINYIGVGLILNFVNILFPEAGWYKLSLVISTVSRI